MIRHTALRPSAYRLAQLRVEAPAGCLGVNEVAPDLLAGYWPNESTVTAQEWADVVAAHTPSEPEPTAEERIAELEAVIAALLEAP